MNTIIVTGASQGIGKATALMAATHMHTTFSIDSPL